MGSGTSEEESSVKRGESLKNGRYVVQSNLGCGTFSTVWLAWDTQFNKYVALKITKRKSGFTETAQHEIKILKFIAENDPEDKQCVVKLLDYFIHIGRHGNHVCLVLELLGENLKTVLGHYKGKGIPLHMVKEICFHVLRGLDYLHNRLSIIHTDLKPENILLVSSIDPEKDPNLIGAPFIPPPNNGESAIASSPSSASKTGKEQMGLKQKGKSGDCGHEANDEEQKLGVGIHLVKNKEWGNEKSLNDAFEGKPLQRRRKLVKSPAEKQKLMKSLDLRCKIADLGNSCEITKQHTSHIQTLYYRCPETLLQSPYSTPADLWSVACIAFELATGYVLFDPGLDKEKDWVVIQLGLMMEHLGVMPKEIALGGKLSTKFFDENGNLKGYRRLQFRPLINLLQESFSFSAKDADEFSDFLGSLLDFVPNNRATARQALHHPWFNGVPHLLQPPPPPSSQTQESESIKKNVQQFNQEECGSIKKKMSSKANLSKRSLVI